MLASSKKTAGIEMIKDSMSPAILQGGSSEGCRPFDGKSASPADHDKITFPIPCNAVPLYHGPGMSPRSDLSVIFVEPLRSTCRSSRKIKHRSLTDSAHSCPGKGRRLRFRRLRKIFCKKECPTLDEDGEGAQNVARRSYWRVKIESL